MSETTRRAGGFVLLAFGVMLLYAVFYQYGMAAFEGVQVSYLEALHFVVETFTTTGYGEQAGLWESRPMLVLTILMQLTGVTMIFMTLPLFIVPLFEEALSSGPPASTSKSDHVVICTFSQTASTLIDELEAREKPYVVVEGDSGTAQSLHDDGFPVVEGDPEDVETLEAANAAAADALVVAAGDETNASVILAAQDIAPACHVVSVVEDEDDAIYHRYAGADEVISPRQLLGQSLASKATARVTSDIGDAVEIGADFDIAELLVQRDSPIEGRTIANCGVDDLPGTNVIGAWFRGEFVSPPEPERVIDEHTILLIAGPSEGVEHMTELTRSSTRRHRRGPVVVGGLGVIGETVVESTTAADIPTTVIDLEDRPGVDIVGDVTEPATLREADLPNARALVLAVDDDTTAVFATLVARQVAENVELVARANEVESVPKLYRAGAEYVLALPIVAGRMLASKLLDEEVITPEMQVELVRTAAPRLAGMSLEEADVRARTNCTIVAAERDGELFTRITPDFVVEEGDRLICAGNDEAIARFTDLAT